MGLFGNKKGQAASPRPRVLKKTPSPPLPPLPPRPLQDVNVLIPKTTVSLMSDTTKLTDVAPWLSETSTESHVEGGPLVKLNQQTPSLPKGPTLKSLPEPAVNLLVGKQITQSRYITPRLFQIPTATLKKSRLLSKYYRDAWRKSASSTIVRLPDLDPDAFEMYYEWATTGEIFFPRELSLDDPITGKLSWAGCWPLVNAFVVSTVLSDYEFRGKIMRLLREKVERKTADAETIKHVFTTPDMDMEFKRFIIDEALAGGLANFRVPGLSLYSTEFIRSTLRRISQRVQLANSAKGSSGVVSREGNPTPFRGKERDICPDPVMEIRERLRATLATRISQRARSELEANGIETIDWAVRQRQRAEEVAQKLPVIGQQIRDVTAVNVASKHDRLTMSELPAMKQDLEKKCEPSKDTSKNASNDSCDNPSKDASQTTQYERGTLIADSSKLNEQATVNGVPGIEIGAHPKGERAIRLR
jgi:hypothetical protein